MWDSYETGNVNMQSVQRERNYLPNVYGFELPTFQISLFNNKINMCGIERCKMYGYER
jgi:hypothetical protein